MNAEIKQNYSFGVPLFEDGLFSKIKKLEMPIKHFMMLFIISSF
jgi:hypothetical protein